MERIEGIGVFNRGLGLISDALGIKPDQTVNPNTAFSRLLEGTLRQEQHHDANSVPSSKQSDVPVSPGIIPRQTNIDRESKLYEQCRELETFLVKNILNAMRKNVMKSSLIEKGYAGEVYEDMLWDEYAKEYTKNAGFGLADLAYLELTGQRGRRV